jgi:hypothetical protein
MTEQSKKTSKTNYLRRNKSRNSNKNKNNAIQTPDQEQLNKTDLKEIVIEKEINGKSVVTRGTSNLSNSVSRFGSKQSSYPALSISAGKITEERIKALQYTNLYKTVNEMVNDDAIALGYFTKRSLLQIALSKFKIKKGRSNSKASKEAYEFIKYIFDNIDQPWYDIISNVTTYPKYGFSLQEIVTTTIKDGKFKGKKKLKRLSPISAKSVEDWVFTDDQRELLGIVQSTSWLNDTGIAGANKFKTITDYRREDNTTGIAIPIERLMHFAYNSEANNPLGESQFKRAYIAWREKVLIQDLALVGVSKDMSGVIHIEIPSEILNKAANDPTSPEAAVVQQMESDAANISANSQAFFMVPTDVDEHSKGKLYSMTLKGVEGGSKNYDADAMVSTRRKAILDIFGVGFIDNNSNSYNSSEAGANFHELLLESEINFILEPFNNKLIPTLLALNGFRVDSDEAPYIEAGNVTERSRDETSKFIQRVFAVNGLPRTKEIILQLVEDSGLPTQELEDLDVEEIWELMGWNPEDKPTSRSSQGMENGMPNGTGDSNGSSGDSSSSNSENAE